MTEYVVVIEQDGDAWGAYVPDLPGCVAAGASREEVTRLIADAVPLHVASLQAHGDAVPTPTATGTTPVQVASRLAATGHIACKRLRGTYSARSEELESPTF